MTTMLTRYKASIATIRDHRRLQKLLRAEDTEALLGFDDNWPMIEKFFRTYYGRKTPRTMLLGINPGRFAAGKTGVPFMDFRSLAKLLPDVTETGSERSATFLFEVIRGVGAKKFFANNYVTNVSPIGFLKDGKNLNYFELSDGAQKILLQEFRAEVERVNPRRIIALSQTVRETCEELLADMNIKVEYLPHPNYCAFPSHRQKYVREYVKMLG